MKNFPFLALLKGNKFQANENIGKTHIKIKSHTLKKFGKNKNNSNKADIQKSLTFLIALLFNIQNSSKSFNTSSRSSNSNIIDHNNKIISDVHKDEIEKLIPDLSHVIDQSDYKKIKLLLHKLLSESNIQNSSKTSNISSQHNSNHNSSFDIADNNKITSIINKIISDVYKEEIEKLIPDLSHVIDQSDYKKIKLLLHKLLSESNIQNSSKSLNSSSHKLNSDIIDHNNQITSVIDKIISNIHKDEIKTQNRNPKEDLKNNFNIKTGFKKEIMNLLNTDQSNKSHNNNQNNRKSKIIYEKYEKTVKPPSLFVKEISIEKKESIKSIFRSIFEKSNIKKDDLLKVLNNNPSIFDTNFSIDKEITTEKNEQDILNQVKEAFIKLLRNNVQKITVKLHPPELGRLVIIIKLQKRHIDARIHTENHKVTNFIKENIANIEDALNNLGYKVHKVDVKTAFSFEKQFLSDQGSFSRKEKRDNQERKKSERLYKILSLNKSDEELAQIMLLNKRKEKNSLIGLDIVI